MRFSSLAAVRCLLCKDNHQEDEDGSVLTLKQISVGEA